MRVALLIITAVIIFAISCKKEDDPNENETPAISLDSLSGWVQKGPFISGSSITLFELNEQMNQTGRVFNTQIISNSGTFRFRGIELQTTLAECKADGFYFNEILNAASSAQLTLYSFSDLTDRTGMNVNVLSHLERRRVQFLINEGMNYSDAKEQAMQEILAIFEIDKGDISEAESLTISGEGDDNAILLAVSIILQGYRNTAELSELLATISEDIFEDGTLDSEATGSRLINHARNLDMPGIRSHLEERYAELGLEATIPDFEKYLNGFIENSPFTFTEFIVYPASSRGGTNILHPSTTTIQVERQYCMTAELPAGASLKIRLSGALWYYQTAPNPVINWNVGEYDWTQNTQVFESIEPGKTCDLLIEFSNTRITGQVTIEYFINNSEEPVGSRILEITGYDEPDPWSMPRAGRFGENILHENVDTLTLNQQYSMIATLGNPYNALQVLMEGGTWETSRHESGMYDWNIMPYDSSMNSQLFTTLASDTCDMGITFTQPSEINIEYKDEFSGDPQYRTIRVVDQ